jgi:hypothetical protein
MENLIVKTSEAGWLPKIAKAYQERATLVIVDDAGVGIDPSQDTLFAMGKKAGLNGLYHWCGHVLDFGGRIRGHQSAHWP